MGPLEEDIWKSFRACWRVNLQVVGSASSLARYRVTGEGDLLVDWRRRQRSGAGNFTVVVWR